ncbi:MAG: rhodanese [Chthoniobacter sp.]|jgi:rhodanese-related sulfurtransferase|nr:rhodanese [Chthoniobacter sp.]
MIRTALRQAAALLALALLPAVPSGISQLTILRGADTKSGQVEMATVQSWGDKVLWVDARAKSSFDKDHIPGAVPLNEDEWDALVPAFLDAWQPENPVVIYCDRDGCDASEAVARRLREELQLDNVWVLKGGWRAWQQR